MKKNFALAFIAVLFGNLLFAQTEPNLINSTGNVGIGTTSPTEKLTVTGRVRIDSTLTVNDSMVVKKDLRVNKKLTVDQKVVMKEDAVVRQDFKVLGNTRLEGNNTIDGNLKLPNLNLPNNYLNKHILLVNDNGIVQKSGPYAVAEMIYQPIQCIDGFEINPIWSNGPSKIYVDCPTDVKVGIGTAIPNSTLDVRGLISTFSLAMGVDPANMVGRFHLKTNASGNSHTVLLIENPTKKLMQLDNQGLLKVREVKVDLVAWPDYVFEEDYLLMPLKEVEAFIKEKGHLPNVPSAETVETEGLTLGEMNKILMEKVEQLTLYAIDQEKRMQEQAERNEKQDALIIQLQNQLSTDK